MRIVLLPILTLCICIHNKVYADEVCMPFDSANVSFNVQTTAANQNTVMGNVSGVMLRATAMCAKDTGSVGNTVTYLNRDGTWGASINLATTKYNSNCWCKMDVPASSKWAYIGTAANDLACRSTCVSMCAQALNSKNKAAQAMISTMYM